MTVIPRLASTVILLDQFDRVYLTKRPITMKCLGGFYVFPGGAVDKEDYVQDNKHIKKKKQNESFDPVHYVAAARELFEEVGILLCHTDDEISCIPFDENTRIEYSRKLVKGEMSFLQMLENEGLHFTHESLKYFGHQVTPKGKPIRYDTRFFLAKLPKGQIPKPNYHEIDKASWFSPDEALEAFQNKKIFLARPTIHALKSVINYLDGQTLMMTDSTL